MKNFIVNVMRCSSVNKKGAVRIALLAMLFYLFKKDLFVSDIVIDHYEDGRWHFGTSFVHGNTWIRDEKTLHHISPKIVKKVTGTYMCLYYR